VAGVDQIQLVCDAGHWHDDLEIVSAKPTVALELVECLGSFSFTYYSDFEKNSRDCAPCAPALPVPGVSSFLRVLHF